jgi:hypothetical protein
MALVQQSLFCAQHGDVFKIKGIKNPRKQGEDFHICPVEVARPADNGQDLPVIVHKRNPENVENYYQVHSICGNVLHKTPEAAQAWEAKQKALDKADEDARAKRLKLEAKQEALEAAKAAATAKVEADFLAEEAAAKK